ncbi:hypothetical protein GCM10023091_33150 [Ravibacter arvi]|uniref:HmuY protein n=1 Tax=Ravibacter arvi TaxID=2051041 RepID=A0ABP8M6Q3_9BACT
MKNKITGALLTLIFLFAANACKDDEPPLPDNLIQFEASQQGVPETEQEVTVKVKLSRATEAATTVVVDLKPTGITYGKEFTTVPEAANNSVSLPLPAGSTEGSLKIVKAQGVLLGGTETLELTLKSATAPVLAGKMNQLSLKFAQIISTGSQMTINGLAGSEPGSSAANSVYVDFSNNSQTAVLRSSWDLGFYCGSEFRVILNNTTSASAKMLNKTDLKAVTAADTIPAADWTVGAYNPKEMGLVDNVTGDLTKTIIAEIAADDATNKVYIINRGIGGGLKPRPWLKIRVLRNGATGYKLQYARIEDTTVREIDVTKDASFNFVYAGFDGTVVKKVNAEPQKSQWDIKWGYQLIQTALSPTEMIPYGSSDFVAINNRGGVQAAEVLTSTVSYDAFGESHLAAVQFKSNFDVIGTAWRTASATSGASAVKSDRFYVIKDPSGNVYKLKFIRFHGDEGGTRGKPETEYKLVKKGV